MAKKKKSAAGFSFGSIFLMIGKSNITSEHVAQFAAVAKDRILGCATYGK